MQSKIEKSRFRGDRLGLVPLSKDHAEDLIRASCDALPAPNWMKRGPGLRGATIADDINRRLAAREKGSDKSFAIVANVTGRAVGLISFETADVENWRLEIREPWLQRSEYSSSAIIESYLLAIDHAFNEFGCVAVEFRIHRQDEDSRKTLDRLGAQLDATFRNGQIMSDGTIADIAVYSIIVSEWPNIRGHFEQTMAR